MMSSSRCLSWLSLASLLCLRAAAQINYFINPPVPGPTGQFEQDKVYELGSTVDLRWKTNYTTISLVLFQNNNDSYTTLLDSIPAPQSLQWDVVFDGTFNISSTDAELNGTPNIFFFQMWEMIDNNQNIGDRFSSHYFNVSGDQSSASTTPASSSSATGSTTSPISSTTSDSTQTATGTAASSQTAAGTADSLSHSSSNGLSSGTKIGIGVGVGVGVAFLFLGIAIAFFFWRKSRRSSDERRELKSTHNMEHPAPPYYDGSPGGGYSPGQQSAVPYYDNTQLGKAYLPPSAHPTELSGDREMYELSSQAPKHELPVGR